MTLRDVAEAAGVSEMTVSRVLRQRGDVSEKTRERVFAAARTLGYVPNKIAGALASNRVNLVGVVIPSLSNMVFPDVLGGIGSVLDDTPLQPVVGTSKYDPEHEEHVIYEMLSWRPSGLIVAGLEHTEAARAMMANAGIPVVEVMDVDGARSPPRWVSAMRPQDATWRARSSGAVIARSPISARPPSPIIGRRSVSRAFARAWPRRACRPWTSASTMARRVSAPVAR
jgi:hypothetical protein